MRAVLLPVDTCCDGLPAAVKKLQITPTNRKKKKNNKSKTKRCPATVCCAEPDVNVHSLMDNSKVGAVSDILASIADTAAVVARPGESPEVALAMQAMDLLTLEDIGLTAKRVADTELSQCFEIFSSEAFQLAVFIVPAGGKLHLHDHPEMCVMSKLVSGEMQLTSYTRAPCTEPASASLGIPVGQPNIQAMLHPIFPWSLSADSNNFHEVVAVTATVLFEALVCPYSDERPCTFYEAYTSTLAPGNFLRVVEPPDDGPMGIEI
jgi:quercetin dioxygenase-like cupin family protein